MEAAVTARLKDKLRAFVVAKTIAPGPKCSACKLPKELHDAVRAEHVTGTRLSVLAAFLQSEGHKVSQWTLGNHLRDHGQREG